MQVAKQLIGMKMVNNQTGPEGVVAHQVLIAKPVDIEKEYYLGAIIDRDRAEPILIASPEGGMEIEEIAAKHPDKILTVPIGLDGTCQTVSDWCSLCKFMGWKERSGQARGMQIAAGFGKAFIETDASLLEINPLVGIDRRQIMGPRCQAEHRRQCSLPPA